MDRSIFKVKTDLESSEYNNLFGNPFWGVPGNLKAKIAYSQLSEKEKAFMLKANYIKMIEKARERNYNMAADCLQWWLDGTGFTKNIDYNWLRKQREARSAEDVNIERFETDYDTKFSTFLIILEEGKTKDFTTYYDKQFTGGIFGELYYASGTSILTSRCFFKVTKKEKDNYTLSGHIIHSWHDTYDWHKGANAYIPSFGLVKDSDAILVVKYCGAKPFRMESRWKQTFNITFKYSLSGGLDFKLK